MCFLILCSFVESPFLRGVEDRLGGVILVKCIPSEGRGEFLWTHSSKTMCVSYKSDAERRPKVLYSLNMYFLCLLFVNRGYERWTEDYRYAELNLKRGFQCFTMHFSIQ